VIPHLCPAGDGIGKLAEVRPVAGFLAEGVQGPGVRVETKALPTNEVDDAKFPSCPPAEEGREPPCSSRRGLAC